MKMLKRTILLIILCLSTSFLFSSVDKGMDIPLVEERVKIDGNLDESFYKDLVPAEGFFQYFPKNGAEPTFKTQVYSFYDRKNLYFSFKCFDDDPGKIIGKIAPFGKYANNDEVGVYIDTFLDKRTYKKFFVNPRGILKGEQTVWDASARITEDGWSAEFKIPFKSLKFPVKDIRHWSVNFQRFIARLNETCYWTNVKKDKMSNFGDTFGKLAGIKNVKGGKKHIEVYPYAGYRDSRSGDARDDEFIYGMDLKYGITPGLTLDAAVLPDYSDVESDPFFYQVDPYEFELPENRPFYSEDSDTFTAPFRLFYSRRVTDPDLAVKVTGKEKGFSLGTLLAKNDRGENDAYHGVFRLKKEVGKRSHIGVLYSSIEEKGNWNRNAGVDFKLTLKNNYSLEGMVAFSYHKDIPNRENGMYYFLFSRMVNKGLSMSARYMRVEPNVYVPAGYVPYADYHGAFLQALYSFSWKGKWLRRMVLRATYYYEAALQSDLKSEGSYSFTLAGLTKSSYLLSIYYRSGKLRGQLFDDNWQLVWNDTIYPIAFWKLSLSYYGSPVVEYGISVEFKDFFVYNSSFTEIKEGKRTIFDLWAHFKISPQLQLRVSYNKNKYDSTDGSVNFDGDLVFAQLNYQLTKKISTFVKFQYDSSLERFLYDFLIGYEPVYVSKIIFSLKNYSENRFRLFDPRGRSIAVKITYMYRF